MKMFSNFDHTTIFKILFFILLLALPLVFLYLWGESYDLNEKINHNKFGTFGDFFGGVFGSMWALGGVILFYLALKEQRKDFKTNRDALVKQVEALEVQSNEFKLQREELEQSRKVFIEQSKTLKQQRFESTFFSMIDLYNNVVANLNKNQNGKDYFKEFREKLLQKYISKKNPIDCHKNIVEAYKILYYKEKEDLTHYFKILYRILKIIDFSEISEKEKQQYVKILRSQLSENELLILYYNAYLNEARVFYTYILKYNLLKHLPSISKLEFTDFTKNGDDIPVILEFNNEIYQLFITFFKSLEHNIKNDEFEFERMSAPLSSEKNIIILLQSSEYNKVEIQLIPIQEKEQYLRFSKSDFEEYFKMLLYDYLVFSLYIVDQINDFDLNYEYTDNKFLFKVQSKKKLILNHDKEEV